MGTTVIGGMLAATLIAVFIIPVLFVMVEKLARKSSGITVVPAHPHRPAAEEEPHLPAVGED
jgi:hypothetical protein